MIWRAVAVVQRQEQDDQAAGREPAEVAVALDQDDVGALPSGRDGRGHAGGAAADDEHVALGHDRHALLRKRDVVRHCAR